MNKELKAIYDQPHVFIVHDFELVVDSVHEEYWKAERRLYALLERWLENGTFKIEESDEPTCLLAATGNHRWNTPVYWISVHEVQG